jgi:hypothetical protein
MTFKVIFNTTAILLANIFQYISSDSLRNLLSYSFNSIKVLQRIQQFIHFMNRFSRRFLIFYKSFGSKLNQRIIQFL